MEALNICARMVYIYNETQEDHIDISFGHSSEAYEKLRKATDAAINRIKFQDLSCDVKNGWMTDKLAYVTWARDLLILNENDKKIHNK